MTWKKNDRFLNVIFTIEKRERETKNAILRSTKKKKEKGSPTKNEEKKKKGDAYESDDSWIDDLEYTELVIPDEGEEGGNTFHSSEEEDDENTEEKVEETLLKEEKKKIELHVEMDEALKRFEENSKNFDYKSKKVPDKLNDDLLNIAIVRQKHYPKGVSQPIVDRIQNVLGLAPQTIKKKLADAYNTFMTRGTQGKEQIDKLKEELKKKILVMTLKKSLLNINNKTNKPQTTKEEKRKINWRWK